MLKSGMTRAISGQILLIICCVFHLLWWRMKPMRSFYAAMDFARGHGFFGNERKRASDPALDFIAEVMKNMAE